MKSINPNSAKGPDKGKIVNKLFACPKYDLPDKVATQKKIVRHKQMYSFFISGYFLKFYNSLELI